MGKENTTKNYENFKKYTLTEHTFEIILTYDNI